MTKKIYHEAPMAIFKEVQALTDGDYALPHLFNELDGYYEAFLNRPKGREMILDNSVFELGKSISCEDLVRYIQELQPDYYVVPDILGDGEATIQSFLDWNKDWDSELDSKKMGVVQGSTYKEMAECYKFMAEHADIIAFPFNTSRLLETEYTNAEVTDKNMMYARSWVLNTMPIDETKLHHLLGVALPQEMFSYRSYSWIVSVDTSNPVLHGLVGKRYETINSYAGTYGLTEKDPTKMHTLMDKKVDNMDIIKYNISKFREIVNGR